MTTKKPDQHGIARLGDCILQCRGDRSRRGRSRDWGSQRRNLALNAPALSGSLVRHHDSSHWNLAMRASERLCLSCHLHSDSQARAPPLAIKGSANLFQLHRLAVCREVKEYFCRGSGVFGMFQSEGSQLFCACSRSIREHRRRHKVQKALVEIILPTPVNVCTCQRGVAAFQRKTCRKCRPGEMCMQVWQGQEARLRQPDKASWTYASRSEATASSITLCCSNLRLQKATFTARSASNLIIS